MGLDVNFLGRDELCRRPIGSGETAENGAQSARGAGTSPRHGESGRRGRTALNDTETHAPHPRPAQAAAYTAAPEATPIMRSAIIRNG